MSGTGTKYHELVVEAASADTDIWIGDMDGHFVVKGTGTLQTRLLAGEYTVEFGLGSLTYPIGLSKRQRYTQADLEACPSIRRPVVKIP